MLLCVVSRGTLGQLCKQLKALKDMTVGMLCAVQSSCACSGRHGGCHGHIQPKCTALTIWWLVPCRQQEYKVARWLADFQDAFLHREAGKATGDVLR
jgi:hypothetical protein